MLKKIYILKNIRCPFSFGTVINSAASVNNTLLALPLALFILLGTTCTVDAQNHTDTSGIVMVTAAGAAQKSEETPDIKSAAIEQALKNAVADVFESVVERERVDVDPTYVETEIYSNAVNFIKNFKVLSEERTVEIVDAPVITPSADGQPQSDGSQSITTDPMPVEIVTHRIWIEAAVDTISLSAALGKILFTDEDFIQDVPLVILDLPGYASYQRLMDSLERIAVIRSTSYNSFTANRYTFKLLPTGGINRLMRRITEEVGTDYIVTGTKGGTIIIKAAPTTISFKKYFESTNVE